MTMVTAQGAFEAWLFANGGNPEYDESQNIRALLLGTGAGSAAVLTGQLTPWQKREVLPALTFALRPRLSWSRSLESSRTSFGFLLRRQLLVPDDWHQIVAVVEESIVDIGHAVMAADDRKHYGDMATRMRRTKWLSSPSATFVRSLLGMLKNDLAVSDEQRCSAFARWLLTLPAESCESSELKSAYVSAARPGGARFRVHRDSDESDGEFMLWLAGFNGGSLRRGASRYVVPLDDLSFIEAVKEVAGVHQ